MREAVAQIGVRNHLGRMRAFADLLDNLIYTRSRNAKLRLIGDYLAATPDPDRGWAMAALTGCRPFCLHSATYFSAVSKAHSSP